MSVLFSLLIASLLWGLPAPQTTINSQLSPQFDRGGDFAQQPNDAQPDLTTQPLITLVIAPLPPIPTGQTTTLSAQLVASTGELVNNLTVVLSWQRAELQRRRTDAAGRVTFTLPKEWPPGIYPLTLHVIDTPTDETVSAAFTVIVEPIRVTIEVIPPLAGIRFALAGRESQSDQEGHLTFTLDKAGDYELELLTVKLANSDYRYEFDRWHDEVFAHKRTVILPKAAFIQVGFQVSYQATPVFVDTGGKPIDPQQIEAMTLQSSHGALLTIAPDQSTWFQANRIMRRSTGLEAVPVQYSLQSVLIDGANVVNRGQQKFFVDEPHEQWPITLIFFPARFYARDALFGWPLGTGIHLTYPNGAVLFHGFDAQGTVLLPALPRGAYQVQVAQAPGLAPLTPVAISRIQEVELLVISYLDMGLFVGAGALFAITLLLVGRPTILRAFSLRRRRPAPVTGVPAYYTLLPTADAQASNGTRPAPVTYLCYDNGYKVWAVKQEDLRLLQGNNGHSVASAYPTSLVTDINAYELSINDESNEEAQPTVV